jgi:methionyl-tRNA formyltransferase
MEQTMRVLFMGNNWVGWQVVQWLRGQNVELAGLVLHPPKKRKYGDEIIAAAGVSPERIFDGSTLRQPETMQAISALSPDLAISIYFGYILKPELIDIFGEGVINLHPSYLPYNRGAHPNIWSIIDGTPAGVSLHYIDAGIDTGALIARQEVAVEPTDTGQSLYQKLEQTSLALFRETWPAIAAGTPPHLPPINETGTFHRVRDVQQVDEIDLERSYTGRELINILRARTFPPYGGAYFLHEGKKIYVRLQLIHEDEL